MDIEAYKTVRVVNGKLLSLYTCVPTVEYKVGIRVIAPIGTVVFSNYSNRKDRIDGRDYKSCKDSTRLSVL